MIDRAKVIKGLTICYKPPAKCEDCPYHDLPDDKNCNDALCLDALELLKNQQEIVRCEDCFYSDCCEIYAGWDGQHPDWFCADGKRR